MCFIVFLLQNLLWDWSYTLSTGNCCVSKPLKNLEVAPASCSHFQWFKGPPFSTKTRSAGCEQTSSVSSEAQGYILRQDFKRIKVTFTGLGGKTLQLKVDEIFAVPVFDIWYHPNGCRQGITQTWSNKKILLTVVLTMRMIPDWGAWNLDLVFWKSMKDKQRPQPFELVRPGKMPHRSQTAPNNASTWLESEQGWDIYAFFVKPQPLKTKSECCRGWLIRSQQYQSVAFPPSL